MRTIDTIVIDAPLPRVYAAAAHVEGWPQFLEHYRWVRRIGRDHVEMAAWRQFGPLRWPTWWVSSMTLDPTTPEVRYRHIRGITAGMDVVWRFTRNGRGVTVEIVHEWRGPRWPLIGRLAADAVIGPVFIHHIASRTLAGVKRRAEAA